MRTRTLIAAAGLAALAGLAPPGARGQDPKPADRVEVPPDVIPSAFRMFLVTDARFGPVRDAEGNPLKGPDGKDVPSPKNRANKIHCLVCEYGLSPVVAVFARGDPKALANTGVAKLTKDLNALIPKHRSDKLSGFVAFLRLEGGPKAVTLKTKRADGTVAEQNVQQDKEYPDDEKRAAYVDEVLGFAAAVDGAPNVPLGLAADKSKALTAWGVGDDEVTVVVYHRMRRVGQPWRFAKAADLTDEKVAEILKAAVGSFSNRK